MYEVELPVGQFDINPQLWIQTHEARHQRHDEALTVSHGAAHAQHASGLTGQVADRAQRLFTSILQALAVLQESLPGLGQRDPTGAAVEQTGLQAFFEAYNLSTDVRGRNPEAFGRSGELAAFGHGDK